MVERAPSTAEVSRRLAGRDVDDIAAFFRIVPPFDDSMAIRLWHEEAIRSVEHLASQLREARRELVAMRRAVRGGSR